MVQTSQNDVMYANNRRVITWPVKDEDGTSVKDLSGLTVKYALTRIGPNGPITTGPLIDKSSSGADVTITDAINGIVTITLNPADTAALAAAGETVYYHELEVFDGSGNGVVVATGNMTIRPNITNA